MYLNASGASDFGVPAKEEAEELCNTSSSNPKKKPEYAKVPGLAGTK